MVRRILAALVLVAAFTAAGCTAGPARQLVALRDGPSAQPSVTSGPLPPVKILLVGDSIAWGFGTQLEADGIPEGVRPRLGQLLGAAGQPYQLEVDAVPATTAAYWLPRIDAIVAAFQPDLAIFALGTNSDCVPDNGATLQSQMTSLYNSALHSRLWHVKIEPVFISYSRPGDASPWVVASEPVCNDAIYRAQAAFPVGNAMIAGYADWSRIPSSLLVKDGIHYSPRAYQVAAELIYDGAAATYGWPPVPPSCGLDGRRPGYPSTDGFTPCPAS
jgi:lysophospholipase L1-like esterase